LWNDQDVQHRIGGMRTFDHPKRGRLSFDQHSFSPTERQDFKLVLLVPHASPSRRSRSLSSPR
ncbi:MmyB family transcriptional regulator, partial [Klebsiella aerogenes]|uniref:MmyB family transcriptional regulator n=2 Tax=Pseudomonadota TaxID=1224 RepID=UPI003F685597